MSERLRVVVAGLIGQYPIGGVAWDYVQYLLGLRALGHDVVYVEDTNQWPYDTRTGAVGGLGATNVAHLARVMEHFGLGDRWAYHFIGFPPPTHAPARWFGLSDARRREVLREADLLINVSSGIGIPDRYCAIPRLVYVDTDPVFTQIRAVQDPPSAPISMRTTSTSPTASGCRPPRPRSRKPAIAGARCASRSRSTSGVPGPGTATCSPP